MSAVSIKAKMGTVNFCPFAVPGTEIPDAELTLVVSKHIVAQSEKPVTLIIRNKNQPFPFFSDLYIVKQSEHLIAKS